MELKITTLIENMPDEEEKLCFEHGLSLYIEFGGKKILFDTGQSGSFLKNAEVLKKSVQELDYVIISHGHYDHSGGVPALLEVLEAPVSMYVGKGFFGKKYKKLSDGTYRYNGNPFTQRELAPDRIALHEITEDITRLHENILLFKNFHRVSVFEKPNSKFFLETEEGYVLDEFSDEIALGLCTQKGLVLIVGCSHVGISNILQNVKERVQLPIYAVLGGTHLMEADEERLQKTMEAFHDCGVTQIAVSHCTGEQGILCAEQEFGKNFICNNTGNVYCIE